MDERRPNGPTARHTEKRPDPDALIAAAVAEGRGRLKIFLGAAPGVGKTWEMLVAARARAAEGADVLVGVVETHGRQDTADQLGSLPLLPRRAIDYRGQTLQEFDADAALLRRPALLLVDELAHTNAPGSRHAKRWEDVAEILDAGIDVWATLNVQHLESLNDAVARITGIRVTETVPDRVLEMAQAIEVIDIPPAELQARLRDGKIYRPDVAARALNGFFKEGNLAALREIALRRAAEHVDSGLRDYMRRHSISGPWPAGERVLALVGPDSAGVAVVRQAKRLADALHAPWIALHVEHLSAQTGVDARVPLNLAAQLGAEIEVRAGVDLVAVAIDLATARNVTQLVLGRARPALWRRITGRTLAYQFLRRAPDFALHVVPGSTGPIPRRRLRPAAPWWGWTAGIGMVAAITGVGELMNGAAPEALGMVYLAAVVVAASVAGLRVSMLTAALGFLAWDFFFLPPVYSITISNAHDAIALAVFALVAGVSGSLASRVRAEARAGQARIQGLRRIGAFSRKLGEPTTEADLLAEIARQAADIAGQAVVLTGDPPLVRRAVPEDASLDPGSTAAASWSATKQEEAGAGTGTLPSAAWRFVPMRTVRGLLGVIGVRPAAGPARDFDAPTLQTIAALADQAAVALERVTLAHEAARTAAMEETQRLRTALLNSLSHDLRTPLTGIRGAAETLALGNLPEATRMDLLASIQQDTARMTRFLTNIMDLTRLESGQIQPRLGPVALPELVAAAIARVPDADQVAVNFDDGMPMVQADAALLEQVLVNVLDNAQRYAPGGSLIRVRGTLTGPKGAAQMVTLEIADEGVGIPADDLPHVFDSFYRARRGDRVAPGTGLGLAIARGLIEAMGGRIAAISPRPDVPRDASPGTLIILTLPAA